MHEKCQRGMPILTIDDHTAALTAIADGFAFHITYMVKISSAYIIHLETFRAAAVAQLIFGNDKMAVPTLQLVAFGRYQP